MKRKRKRITSGAASKALWRDINKLRDPAPLAHAAIYHLACKCQELETLIAGLEERVSKLERL